MSNYNSLKTTINANVKTNGNQEITGAVMNSVLNAMVTSLGAGYQFMGVATPETNPGTPDQRLFYLAFENGDYNYFGVEVNDEICALIYDTEWTKVTIAPIDSVITEGSSNLVSSGAVVDAIEDVAKEGFLFDVKVVIPITQGQAVLSRVNIISGVNYPAGKVLKFRLHGTSVLSVLWIVNNWWHSIYKGAYTDGDILTVTLAESTTSIGLYVEAASAIGTGDVTVELVTDYATSIGGRLTAVENASIQKHYITIKREGTSGVDADFCGLNAIGDALASITDANEKNQYFLMIEGHFLFTNPKMVDDGGDFKYVEGGEPSVIIGKKWVHFIGVDKSKAVIEVNLDGSLTSDDFPAGLTFTDYQPLYVRQGCEVRNITFIGTNVRYVGHIEVDSQNQDNGCTIDITDCDFICRTSTKGYKSCFTIGAIPYFHLNYTGCTFYNENGLTSTLFGGHGPLSNITNGRENCKITFKNCIFPAAGNFGVGVYAYNRKDIIVFDNCQFTEQTWCKLNAAASVKRPIGTLISNKFLSPAVIVTANPSTAVGLRVTAISGTASSVRFDPTCSAFGVVGDAAATTVEPLPWGATKQYGYEFKDAPSSVGAYACGWVNIDPSTGSSLGSILGNCSVTPKTLRITINGTNYDVVFNTNLTSETNANIINAINAVIGSVASCDAYAIELNEFPEFEGEEYNVQNGSNALIQRGMGVVKTAYNVIRAAKQSDGRIDGIAVDSLYPGQKGRIITKGVIFNMASSSSGTPLSIYPVLSGIAYNTDISIDADNDGQFIKSSAAPVLKGINYNTIRFV